MTGPKSDSIVCKPAGRLAIPEAIALSGIGRSTFYEIFKAGKLKPRKQGKRTLILLRELEAYLESLPEAE